MSVSRREGSTSGRRCRWRGSDLRSQRRASSYALGGLGVTRPGPLPVDLSHRQPWTLGLSTRQTCRCIAPPRHAECFLSRLVQRQLSRSGRRRRRQRDEIPELSRPVEGGGCPARQSPTGPDTSGDSVGGVYESSGFVNERGGGSAPFCGQLHGLGASRYDAPHDDLRDESSRKEGIQWRSCHSP
jgi:hypothetical protein